MDSALARDNAAKGYAGAVTHASLHTADPAGTGASEVTGGSPAYARQSLSGYTDDGSGTLTWPQVTFDIPPGTSVTHVGLWAGTTYYDKVATTGADFASQGKLNVTVVYTQSA